ncbi:MAG TPA: formate dehydrogenase accessory sulfurtransferase FdhD [Accumulibacter sp.]|jgi:FdhD protein|nr:formate dehydrogenase accessory sulfurtransferase FdhD [Accumulibacter sp.]HQC80603.1 formate dehydrogenase accessory sulfurtransferase FdhD [Accumulibacter sp.]
MKPPLQLLAVRRPGEAPRLEAVAEETPVALEYNGVAHAVMLATPADLEDFALGFSLSEGIVARRGEVFAIEAVESTRGIALRIDIAGEAFARFKARRRGMAGRTGCGLCGVESLAQVTRDLPPLPSPTVDRVPFPLTALFEGMRRVSEQQSLQRVTGATHAAAHVARDGLVGHLREDVGRHNALDKTLGALAKAGVAVADGALVVTSRASFEMVQKAAALGYGILAAVSAPTAAAVRLAESLNLTLVGFLRDADCAIYSHPERLRELVNGASPSSSGCLVGR